MLTLKEPIQLNSQRGLTTVPDSLNQRITGNYGLMGAQFAPKDLLFALTAPVEFPEDMGGMTTIAIQQNTTDMRTITMDVVTNVVNRILLSSTPSFTYQDQVYITSVLNKLGITDVQQFMTQVHQLREDNMSTATLINLYQQELKRLKKGGSATTQEPEAKKSVTDTQVDAPPTERPRHYLHDTIYQRLQTAQVYHTVNSFQRNQVHGAQFFRNQELRTAEQLRISQSLTLQELKQQVNYGDTISLRHHINHYELGDILPPPITQEAVYSHAATAALLTAVDNITVQAVSHTLHRDDLWLNLTQAIGQSAENTLTRFERYHSEDTARTVEHQAYTHTLRELRREEIGWLKSLYQSETNLYVEGAATTIMAPQLPPPVDMTHTEVTVAGDSVEGDTTLTQTQEVTPPPVNLTRIQMALAGIRPPIKPVKPQPTPAPQVETVHRHTETLGGEIITRKKAETTLQRLTSLERELTHLVQEPAALLPPQVIEPIIQRFTTTQATPTVPMVPKATELPTTTAPQADRSVIPDSPTPPVVPGDSQTSATTIAQALAQELRSADPTLVPHVQEGDAPTQPINLIHQQISEEFQADGTPIVPPPGTTTVVEGKRVVVPASTQADGAVTPGVPTTPTPPVTPRPTDGTQADPLTLIHQVMEGSTDQAEPPFSAVALATAVVEQTRQQIEVRTQLANYLTAITTGEQIDIHAPNLIHQEGAQQFLSADLDLPPAQAGSDPLIQQINEINQRNVALHQMVEGQSAVPSPAQVAPEGGQRVDNTYLTHAESQQVVEELHQSQTDSTTLIQQMNEMNQRNVALHQMVETQRAVPSSAQVTPEGGQRVDNTYLTHAESQQVVEELHQSQTDSTTLIQQMNEINQRNVALHQMVEAQRTAPPPVQTTTPDKARTMDDAFRALTDPQQVVKEIIQTERRRPKTPTLPPAAMVALQQADPATRELYEKILLAHQNPQGVTAGGVLQPATIGDLNSMAHNIIHQPSTLTHLTDLVTEEQERHTTHTQTLLEHLREHPTQASTPAAPSGNRPAVHMVHKQEEPLLSEEFLEQLQTKQVTQETTQVVQQQVNHETVQQTDIHNLSKQVVTQATEDITALVNRTMSRQLGTITDKVYQQMERKLQTERSRRGRF